WARPTSSAKVSCGDWHDGCAWRSSIRTRTWSPPCVPELMASVRDTFSFCIPRAIEGFYEFWPRHKKFPKFTDLQLAFGKPIQPPPLNEASEAAYEQLTSELKTSAVAMWQELRDKELREKELSENELRGQNSSRPESESNNSALPETAPR